MTTMRATLTPQHQTFHRHLAEGAFQNFMAGIAFISIKLFATLAESVEYFLRLL